MMRGIVRWRVQGIGAHMIFGLLNRASSPPRSKSVWRKRDYKRMNEVEASQNLSLSSCVLVGWPAFRAIRGNKYSKQSNSTVETIAFSLAHRARRL